MGQTNLTPDFTARLLFSLRVGQAKKMALIRVKEEIELGNPMNVVIAAYLDMLQDLYTMQGLVPYNRIPQVMLLSVEYAPRGGNFTPYGLNFWGQTVVTPVGQLTVADTLKIVSISGRAVSGKKWVHYFYGVTADIASGGTGDIYGDMTIDPAEVSPYLGNWFNTYWAPETTLGNSLVAPDNSPLKFIRPRLLVRFSSVRQTRRRKL